MSGADRNRVQSQAARFDGRAFRPMSATPGNLDWARRAVVAYAAPNHPFPVPGQRGGLVPLPALQAAGLDNATLRAQLEKQPNFAHVSSPVIMPAFWRTPVRAPDAPLLPPGTALSRNISIPTAPAPAPPASAATPAALPPAAAVAVRGAPQVLSTARLIVAGQSVSLAHIEGVEGPQALGLAAFIASRGGTVACEPVPTAAGMRCLTQDGVDLAAAALFNGGGRATPDAPPEYRASEQAARQAGRGVWAGAQR